MQALFSPETSPQPQHQSPKTVLARPRGRPLSTIAEQDDDEGPSLDLLESDDDDNEESVTPQVSAYDIIHAPPSLHRKSTGVSQPSAKDHLHSAAAMPLQPKRKTSSSSFRLFGSGAGAGVAGSGSRLSSGVLGLLRIKPLPMPLASTEPSPSSSKSSASFSTASSKSPLLRKSSNREGVVPSLISPSLHSQPSNEASAYSATTDKAHTCCTTCTTQKNSVYRDAGSSGSSSSDSYGDSNVFEAPDPFYPPEDPPQLPPKGPRPSPRPDPNEPPLPPEQPPKKKGKNIVMCLDGTNETFGPAPHTNVLRLFKLLERADPASQISYYQPGIGAYVKALGAIATPLLVLETVKNGVDAATAYSLDQKIRQAYSFLMRYYEDGDRIYFIGFSRGAFSARVLAGMIELIGLLYPGLEEIVPTAWNIYKTWEYTRKDAGGEPNSGTQMTLADEFKRTFSRRFVKIQFMGLLDSVNSVGIFYDRMFPYTSSTGIIKHIRHAVSIDERRGKFKQYPFSHIYYAMAGKYNNSPNTNASTISTRRNSPTHLERPAQVLDVDDAIVSAYQKRRRETEQGCCNESCDVRAESVESCGDEGEVVPAGLLSNPPSPRSSVMQQDELSAEERVLQHCHDYFSSLDRKDLEARGCVFTEDLDEACESLKSPMASFRKRATAGPVDSAVSSVAGSFSNNPNCLALKPLSKWKSSSSSSSSSLAAQALEPVRMLAATNQGLPSSYWARAAGTTISLFDTPGMNEPTRRSVHGEISPVDHNPSCADVVELWFPGDHSDVGGGWAPDTQGRLFGDVSLRWLLGEALKAGVKFRAGAVDEFARSRPLLGCLRAPVHDSLDARPWGVSADDDGGRAEKRLTSALFWWLLELLPLPTFRLDRVRDRWSRSLVPNFGRRRVVPLDAKFHWSVSWRAMYGSTGEEAAGPGDDEGEGEGRGRGARRGAYWPPNLTALHNLVPLSASAEYDPPDDIEEAVQYIKRHGVEHAGSLGGGDAVLVQSSKGKGKRKLELAGATVQSQGRNGQLGMLLRGER